jgi:uncharacterized RDD family membrane protein YckC
VSGIPVGSPPVPPGRHAAPSGWYADPLDGAQERYWDGWQWSRNTRAREGVAPVTPTAPGTAGPPQPAHPPVQPWSAGQGYPSQPGHQPQGYAPQPGQQPQGYAPQPGQQPQGYPPPPGHQPQGYPGYPGYPVQPVPGQPRQAACTADGVRLAGWWWRVLASLVDGVVVTVLVTLATLSLLLPMLERMSTYFAEVVAAAERGLPQPVLDPQSLLPAGDQLLLALASVGITFVYHFAFLRWRAATPGKLLCGLRVVPVDQGRAEGGLPGQSAAVRALVWAAPGLNTLLMVFQLADVLFPLWQPRRQAIHDLLARTQVVRG